MQRTPIEWTDFSANPLKYRDANGAVVWACVHASPGCVHCYSETLAKRYGRGGPFTVPATAALTPFLDERELRHMLTAKTVQGRSVAGSRCFPFDMTDLFGEWVPDALIDQVVVVLMLRRDVTWQLLTKRAARARAYWTGLVDGARAMTPEFRDRWDAARRPLYERLRKAKDPRFEQVGVMLAHPQFPLPNVWLGVSVEDQRFADERIPLLLQTPAAVRFISAEPLLGPVDLESLDCFPQFDHRPTYDYYRTFLKAQGIESDGKPVKVRDGLDWVIVGGESGPGARPFDLAWARSIVEQCKAASVPVFIKQLGSNPAPLRVDAGSVVERLWLHDRKGGDPAEWPEDLRVREFPEIGR